MDVFEKTCDACHKKFKILITTQSVPGCKEKEEVWCPYCHHFNGYVMTSGEVKIEKMEGE